MFKHKSKVIFNVAVAAFFLIAAAGAAFSQRQSTPRRADNVALGEPEVKQLLLLMDTDQNGKISRQEYMKFMQTEFDRLDVDKSGELDPTELAKSRLQASDASENTDVKQLLLLMDTDQNGKISRQEYMKFMQTEFDRLDLDKNGELDPQELTQSKLRPRTFGAVGR